jgi:predicted hotdog family 3-hydroxylacyl-ACP dehydratase
MAVTLESAMNLHLSDMIHGPLDRQQIALRVPHNGNMCLLERASDWNEDGISVSAVSHVTLDNPLRENGTLSALCAVEYAGQAMALHGSLQAQAVNPRPGFLASVRDVELSRARLDDLPDPLDIRVRRLAGDGKMALYSFDVSSGTIKVATGRMAVAFGETGS